MGADELKQGRCALAQPWLWVDQHGNRFFNESRGSVFVDVYNAMTTAGGVMYNIIDQEKIRPISQQGSPPSVQRYRFGWRSSESSSKDL